MRVSIAHFAEYSTSGQRMNLAVFGAKSTNGDPDGLLSQLTRVARTSGFAVDQAALAYKEGSRIKFHGTKPLVEYLSKRGIPRWTHTIDV